MPVKRIAPGQAIGLLDREQALAVDVREPEEYALGHIAGAVLLPLGQVRAGAAALLPNRAQPLLVYCHSGRRSALAAAILEQLGYTRVWDLGGLNSWPYELER